MAKEVMILNIWQKIKIVSLQPELFFQTILTEIDLKAPVIYYLLLELLILPFAIISSIILTGTDFWITLLAYLGSVVFGLLIFFLVILIYHLIIRAFGGIESYFRTIQAFVYGATPAILLSWIPFVNIAAALYSIYVTIIGISKLQQISKMKALFAYLIPLILIMVVALVIVLTV